MTGKLPIPSGPSGIGRRFVIDNPTPKREPAPSKPGKSPNPAAKTAKKAKRTQHPR